MALIAQARAEHGLSLIHISCEASGRDVTDEDREWPFTAVTYKMNVHCQSRTSCHTWALEIFPENRAVINALDARKPVSYTHLG